MTDISCPSRRCVLDVLAAALILGPASNALAQGLSALKIATIGAGVQGSTTTAIGADIVAFSASRGLFGGVALEGSVMSSDSPADQTYYGQPYGARQLVMQMQGGNPGADPALQWLA